MLLLPYGGVPIVWCIIGLALDFLIFKKWKSLNGLFNLKNPLSWMIAFYFFICLSILWTKNKPEGSFELQQKLSLLIIPILVFANKEAIIKKTKSILWVFVISIFLASIFAILNGLYVKQNHPNELINKIGILPFYSEFYSFLHIAYFAFYITISSIILAYFFYYEIEKNKKIIFVSLFLFFLIPLYYLSSKAAFLAYLIMVGISLMIAIVYSKQKKLYIFIAVLILVSTSIILQHNPRMYSSKKMATELLHPENTNPEISSDVSNGQRIYVIKSSIEVIKSNFLIGVGAGDVIDEMELQYIKSDYKVLAKKKLNCHNQFLESFVELGIFGFFLFLLITFGILIYSVFKMNFLLFIFMIGFVVMACTESFLNHQAGVVFYALMCSVFIIKKEEMLQ
ncbi:MAG: hypothetical protein RJA07_2558 [Bacteroidota bacterium]